MSATEKGGAADELWPLRPRPCHGELFSSWLVRIARCYGMPVRAFCREVWPRYEVWRGNIDRQIEDEALQFLSRKTGVAHAELFSMTLRAHERFACPSPADASSLYFQFANTGHAIRFCPRCLAERQPYFRLEWRLAFVTACLRHRLPLLERCDCCGARCLFGNVGVDRPLASCYRCHRHLAGMGKDIDEGLAFQIELHLEFQQNMFNVLRNSQSLH